MAEKTEQPTSKKRRDSSKKGQTFKSKDLITMMILLAGIFYLAYGMNFSDFTKFYSMTLLYSTQIGINDFLMGLIRIFFLLSLPFIALCALVGMAATLLQTGFSIATEAIKINFKALNPMEGVKKIFSMRTVKELVKSICYLIVFAATCYSLIHNDLRQALTLYRTDIAGLIACWVSLTLKAVLVFIGWSVFVLIADFIVEYFLHFKDLKMDKHEVKQERKESDGNPQIKSARRRAHQEILSGEEMAAVRNSEVVMANPTHIAMAIYFNPEVASLPFIALRCSNMKAKAAIAYAEKIGVPVVRNIPLTRRLYRTYSQYSFVSLNDDVLVDVMDILIWLRQVEAAGMTQMAADVEAESTLPESQQPPTGQS
ncbi:EscU/YscU/HrcU family type III secretion system export apparatus switch protein [Aeromonas hydrophila]|uniref:EscU/YscU/HrcU family type III secretion system export apparatus switch protein n=1 Tax=Aeromonas hydrophila TaxID=644 RepID=UPI000575A5D2|nr:EscU/YscU/HrcU family type III secretion system export apparatus switch protein [Aeromonas hydrophila]KHN56576.1 type III secretion system protein [Aeromonas hydrophila]OFC48178.1 EscU/YscU/HrcU family type III secretion system export apparatus switch protein [Aeromonas hydrophila]OFC50171.1 EscU/YscU/HrcU family type III secretion system export apparatus switch protein [Aeromonas hydrophila]